MNVEAMESALRAAQTELRAHRGVHLAEALPSVVAMAIEAYEQARPTLIKTVRLLEPKPGDVVVFHVNGMTAQQFDELVQQLQQLKEHCPGVQFTAAESVEDITVVRPSSERTRCGFSWDAKGSNTACDARGIEAHDCHASQHDVTSNHVCSCGARHLGTLKRKEVSIDG